MRTAVVDEEAVALARIADPHGRDLAVTDIVKADDREQEAKQQRERTLAGILPRLTTKKSNLKDETVSTVCDVLWQNPSSASDNDSTRPPSTSPGWGCREHTQHTTHLGESKRELPGLAADTNQLRDGEIVADNICRGRLPRAGRLEAHKHRPRRVWLEQERPAR